MEDTQNIQWVRLISRVDIRLVVTGVVILLISLNIYYKQDQLNNVRNLSDQARAQMLVQEETAKLVAKLSQFIILPANDEPVLAIVNDASKVAERAPFFRVAKNGDQLLIYPKFGQAILYRPGVEKIVGMTTIFTPTSQ